ncbi:hypothetical protein AB0L13_39245 [Saccharopolyspora shandongensis]|uniref:hypothetical protein n=1 Tax=Saccharopolyspora shandongensis TaxID=418495 RepID=UPI00341ECD00
MIDALIDQLRLRDDWREVTTSDDITLDLRMLVSRRRELVVDQTRRLARRRETLASFFPGLARAVDVTNLGDLRLLSRYVTPAEIRRPYAEALAYKAISAADSQRVVVPGEARMAEFATGGHRGPTQNRRAGCPDRRGSRPPP